MNYLSINTSRRGGAFRYSRRGLRLRRRGAYSPVLAHGLRVVFAGAQGAAAVVGAFRCALLWKTFTTALRAMEIPPLVANATTFPPLRGGTTTRAYCRDTYEEIVSRSFILPPLAGEVRRSRIGGVSAEGR